MYFHLKMASKYFFLADSYFNDKIIIKVKTTKLKKCEINAIIEIPKYAKVATVMFICISTAFVGFK